MTSFLVQLEEGREVARYELRQPRIVLGRDSEEADLLIEEMGVSRRHALFEQRHGTTVLTDLGSSNGTLLNGDPVSGSVSIESGDEIQLADTAFLFLEEDGDASFDRDSRGPLVVVLMLLVLLVLAGAALLSPYGAGLWGDPEAASLREAAELAEVGVAAWRRGELSKAKRQIKAAYWTLYRSEILEDVAAGQLWEMGMRRLSESLGGDDDVGAVFEDVTRRLEQAQAQTQAQRPAPGGTASRPACRLDQAEGAELSECLQGHVRFVMRELRQSDEGVPPWFYRAVGVRLRKERGSMNVRLARGEQYVPTMRRTLEEARLPPILHYLAMAESGYDPKIGSPAGARGLWQFMKATGRRYGLVIKGKVDERTHPEKSTRAAAEYLNDLTFDFGRDSLLLALASYNKGENGVRRALHTLKDPWADRSYWALVEKELLPDETRQYVARIFAQAVAGEGGVPPRGRLEAAGY